MQSEPLISVVIATYNMGQFVEDAIRSVLGQFYANVEVEVVDDGSSDETRDVVQAIDDPRVRYHFQENAGQTVAKNAGIGHSRGEIIGFCDADDMWRPDKIDQQLPLLEQDPQVGVVYGNYCLLIGGEEQAVGNKAKEFLPYSGSVTRELFLGNFVPFGTAMVRRSLIEELGAFNEAYRMGIDWELWLRLSTKCCFANTDAVVYVYRIWEGQMSKNWRGRYGSAFRIMDDFIAANPGLLDSALVNRAYAHTFVERGRIRSAQDDEHLQGLGDALSAIRRVPANVQAWKLILRILANAAGFPRQRYVQA